MFELAEDAAGAEQADAEAMALLIAEGHYFDWDIGFDALLGHRLDRLQSTEYADGAVEPAAVWLRVDVGAEHDGGGIFIPALNPADQVAEVVIACLEASLIHPFPDEVHAFLIFFGEGQAVDAGLLDLSDFCECMYAFR